MTTETSNTTAGGDAPPVQRWSRAEWMLFALVLLVAIGSRWMTFNRVFDRDPEGCGAFYGQLARNYFRYGIVKTFAVPIQNIGTGSSEIVFYANHPPLLPLLIAGTYKVCSWDPTDANDVPREWQTRLSTTLFTIACAGAIFVILRNRAGMRAATISGVLFSIVPMTLYFGSQPDVINTQLCFFGLLTTAAYLRFHERQSPATFAILCLAFAPMASTDWPAFHLAAVLGLHFVITRPVKRWPWIIAFGFVCAAYFFILYVQVVAVTHDWAWMSRLVKRRALGGESDTRETITLSGWFDHAVFGHALRNHTAYMLVPMLAWVALVALRPLRRQAATPFVGLMLGWAFLHVLVGRQGVYVHEWWWWPLTPAAAMAAGVAVEYAMSWLEAHRAPCVGTNAAVSVALLLVALANVRYASSLLAHPYTVSNTSLNYSLTELGDAVRASAGRNQSVMLAESDETLGLWYYADRPIMRNVWGTDSFDHRFHDGHTDLPFGLLEKSDRLPVALIIPKAYLSPKMQPLLDYCGERYERQDSVKFITFAFERKPNK